MRPKPIIPEFVYENIDSLAGFRERRNLKRSELSEKTGIREGMIQQYELGYQLPTREKYNVLAEFFGWQKW